MVFQVALDVDIVLGLAMDLDHGGDLGAAALRFKIPLGHWIDLSTGISPWSWPVPAVPQSVWRALPYGDNQLEQAAASYYGCKVQSILAVPGSQYALQYAPALLDRGRVAIPQRGYAEHRVAWTKAGHQIVEYASSEALHELVAGAAVDHVLAINPNNPTGELLTCPQLENILPKLNRNGGWLVVDEAFIDPIPDNSLASLCPRQGLIVYRSVGKFFGLAGARLGFMLAPQPICQRVALSMPPWLLSHPARWVGAAALSDGQWQREQRARLASEGEQWLATLQHLLPALNFSGNALFASGTGASSYCQALYQALGRRAVLVRIFAAIAGQSLLRFGLPAPALREQVVNAIGEAVEECACVTG